MLDQQSSRRTVAGAESAILEDNEASLIEQAIDLLYQHELVPPAFAGKGPG